MALRTSEGDKFFKGAGLLVSILMRYPELAAVRFDPETRTMKFTFLAAQGCGHDRLRGICDELRQNLETIHHVERKAPQAFRIEHCSVEGLSLIELIRDVNTLTQAEIALATGIVKESLDESLVRDAPPDGAPLEDDPFMEEELIGEMLEDIRGSRSDRKLIAMREEGRVLVFNK